VKPKTGLQMGPQADALPLIKARRSVRSYTECRIGGEDLLRLAEAGRWAPSASNRQPCVFILVDAPALIVKLMACSPGIIGSPTAVVCVAIDSERRPRGQPRSEKLDAMDAAVATQNILLEAASLGLGACVVVSFSEPLVSELLGLPAGVRPVTLVSVGYAAGRVRTPKRRPLCETVFRNRHGQVVTETAAAGVSDVEHGDGVGVDAEADGKPADAEGAGTGRNVRRNALVASTREDSSFVPGVLDIMVYMLCCARLLYGEPAAYGPYRLVEATRRLGDLLEVRGLVTPEVADLIIKVRELAGNPLDEAQAVEALDEMITAAAKAVGQV